MAYRTASGEECETQEMHHLTLLSQDLSIHSGVHSCLFNKYVFNCSCVQAKPWAEYKLFKASLPSIPVSHRQEAGISVGIQLSEQDTTLQKSNSSYSYS